MQQTPLRIDVVSDLVCPWCVIGFLRLRKVLKELNPQPRPVLQLHPFELNPNMPQGGQALGEYFTQKYGMTAEQLYGLSANLTDLAAPLGFSFNNYHEIRIYNTFDAHRLLQWADEQGEQLALALKLFAVYFTEQKAIDRYDALLDAVCEIGLDGDAAREVLDSGAYADPVKRSEAEWIGQGIFAVPAIILNRRLLISGAQETEFFQDRIKEQLQFVRTEPQGD